jgi:hypothetical protein
LRHPGRRTAAPSTAGPGQLFQGHNRFLELFVFHLQLGEHFVNVHSSSPEKFGREIISRSEKPTKVLTL